MADYGYSDVNAEIIGGMGRPGRFYTCVVAFWCLGMVWGALCWAHQIGRGLGVTGLTHPMAWGTYLTNFVFWIGIAYSGTLISATLFLFRASWRTAIARSSEAMTVFAVMTAGLFPLIQLGRVWVVYWMIPYPNEMTLWPNFQSPLFFDFIAIFTYLTASILFWYTGMIPDLASVRDRATGIKRKIYGFLSLYWTGAHRNWGHYGRAYLFFSALATPLVISALSVVSWDFALSIVPGWHSTIFAPHFVVGAIHSGLGMVLVLLIPLRKLSGFENIITLKTLENVAKTLILTGIIIGYSYGTECFIAWYSGDHTERYTFLWRTAGDYAPQFWFMLICNCIAPLLFFFRRFRTNPVSLYTIAMLIVIGMWFERYVIIVGFVAREFDPYSWATHAYSPTWVEYGMLFGSFSLFFFLFFLFAQFLPAISIAEMKEELPPPLRRRMG